jgi:hypothetical protein
MSDNLQVKDASGESQTIRTTETDGIHTPHHIAEGPLTNEELRSSPVSVSGPLTDAQLRATPISTNGITDAQLRADPVEVTGGLTDDELRASPVQVELSNTSQMPVEDAPLSSGYYNVEDDVVSVAVPSGGVMVRLTAVDGDIKFRLGSTNPTDYPVIGLVANTLESGGYVVAGETRTARIHPEIGGYLHLLSAETGSGSHIVSVLVEFTGNGAS